MSDGTYYGGLEGLNAWLRSVDAYTVLDDAVLGCLDNGYVIELCEDYSVTRAQFGAALASALAEGN